ncbi:lipoprotein [Achromobacter sp. GG226]|nr:lipoprotein [Verticiella sp. GG226]
MRKSLISRHVRPTRIVAALCLCTLLAACGQKGPLFLPEPPPPAPETPAS